MNCYASWSCSLYLNHFAFSLIFTSLTLHIASLSLATFKWIDLICEWLNHNVWRSVLFMICQMRNISPFATKAGCVLWKASTCLSCYCSGKKKKKINPKSTLYKASFTKLEIYFVLHKYKHVYFSKKAGYCVTSDKPQGQLLRHILPEMSWSFLVKSAPWHALFVSKLPIKLGSIFSHY